MKNLCTILIITILSSSISFTQKDNSTAGDYKPKVLVYDYSKKQFTKNFKSYKFKKGDQWAIKVNGMKEGEKNSLEIKVNQKNYNQKFDDTPFTFFSPSKSQTESEEPIAESEMNDSIPQLAFIENGNFVAFQSSDNTEFYDSIWTQLSTEPNLKVLDTSIKIPIRNREILSSLYDLEYFSEDEPSEYHYGWFQVENKDEIEIMVSRKNDKTFEKENSFTRNIKGGFKIDFSAGMSISWLKDHEFVLKKLDDENNEVIPVDNTGISLGTVGLVHARGRKWNAPFDIGLTTGLRMDSDISISLLTAASCFWGYQQRMVLSAGFEHRQTKRLSPTVPENMTVSNATTEVPMVEKWSSAPFIAISYNF